MYCLRRPCKAEEADRQAWRKVKEPVQPLLGLQAVKTMLFHDFLVPFDEGEEGEVGEEVANTDWDEGQTWNQNVRKFCSKTREP